MRLVDTAALAVWLATTPREIRRMVAAGEFKPRGQWGKGSRRGRPGWYFDLDNLRGELDAGSPAVNHGHDGALLAMD
jgi:hypothetical protein